MRLIDNLLPRTERPRDLVTPSSFGFNGNNYPIFGWQGSRPDWPDRDFVGYITGIHERNGVVAAAVETRALILSQLWFEWINNGERFTNRSTRSLNNPSRSVTRPAFLKSLEYDASYHGSAYIVNIDGVVRRLRPDRCSVLLASESDPEWDGTGALVELPWDAEVVGLVYHPQAVTGGQIAGPMTVFGRGQFTIWAPEPDPLNLWRGTSWVTAVMREIVADGQSIDHTSKFFENAATPNLVFIMDPAKTPTEIQNFAQVINGDHTGTGKAFKNLFLGGGTDVKTVGSTLDSLNIKDLTGGFETRIALRARIPGVILGIREGYAGSSLNAGNYGSARRMLADGWFSPTAESLCASLERIVSRPAPNAELTYDRSRVLFLQEDQKDEADIAAVYAQAYRQYVDAGVDPATIPAALKTGDLDKLTHSGLASVQLQPLGGSLESGETDDDDD